MPDIANLSPAWLSLIGAVIGGTGLKLIEHWLNRSKVKDDSATALRNEIRTDLKEVRAELAATEKELYEWRDRYYILLEDVLSQGYRLKKPEAAPPMPTQVDA